MSRARSFREWSRSPPPPVSSLTCVRPADGWWSNGGIGNSSLRRQLTTRVANRIGFRNRRTSSCSRSRFRRRQTIDDSRSEQDWLEELEHLLGDAVKIRLMSDVPVGAFLSGGVDSATVCALASQHLKEPLRAFTISTDDPSSDEAADAAQVAARLGLRHVAEKCRLDPHSLITELVTTFDEPFSDLSMAPTYHVAQLAAQIGRAHV